METTKGTAGVAWMLLATVLYTGANLCVKALAHLPTQELVFFAIHCFARTHRRVAKMARLFTARSKSKVVADSWHFRNNWTRYIFPHVAIHSNRKCYGYPIPQSNFHSLARPIFRWTKIDASSSMGLFRDGIYRRFNGQRI